MYHLHIPHGPTNSLSRSPDMAIQSNSLMPSETAFNIAVLSAQTVSP